MLDLVVRTVIQCVCGLVQNGRSLISSFKKGWFSSDAMADVLVNAPPVVQLEQLQPPRGVVAGFSSEAELSQQQVELQEQQQQLLLQCCGNSKRSCSSFGAFGADLSSEGLRSSAHRSVIRELYTPCQASFHLGVLCFPLPPRGEKG